MSSISSLNPYASLVDSSLSSILGSSASVEDDPAADEVTISDEAIELLAELKYKKNMTTVTTDSQMAFDKVSKRIPNTEAFTDMLNWLSTQESEEGFSIGGNVGEVNRDAYEKDPQKYAELWTNLYNHFDELISSLNLDGDTTMMREVLSNDDVQLELMTRFKQSFSDDTNNLLGYFNITV